MGRAPCCDKANVKRGPWSPEEDATLKRYVETHGTVGNWIALPQKAGLRRCGKSCRLRWLNYLRPDIKHGNFTEDEDQVIWALYSQMGSRWSIIASHLPGRTDNDVKNYWNTKLKKKLLPGKVGFTSKSNEFPNSNPTSLLDSTAPSLLKSEPFDLHFSASQTHISSSMLPKMLADIDTRSLSVDPNQFPAHTEHALVSELGTNLKSSSTIVASSQEGSSVSESNNSHAGMDNRALSFPSHGSDEESGILMEYFSFGNPYQSVNNEVWFQEKASHDQVQVPLICYPNIADSSYADIRPQGLINQSVINQY